MSALIKQFENLNMGEAKTNMSVPQASPVYKNFCSDWLVLSVSIILTDYLISQGLQFPSVTSAKIENRGGGGGGEGGGGC